MHLSSFGMYGFAILSSADFRKTMSFCERYHVLSTPLVTLTFREEHGAGAWSVDPIVQTPINDPLYRFIVEMQMGIILSLMRDVGARSYSLQASFARFLSAELTFDLRNTSKNARSSSADRSMSSIFDATWLDASAELGDRITYALVICSAMVWSRRCRSSRASPERYEGSCCRMSADSLL